MAGRFRALSLPFLAGLVGVVSLLAGACSPAGSIRTESRPGEPVLSSARDASGSGAIRPGDAPAGDAVDGGGDGTGGGDPAGGAAEDPTEGGGSAQDPGGDPEPGDDAANVRVARSGTWQDTTCPMTPADSFWRTPVDDLPTLQPRSPSAGAALADFPASPDGTDALALRPGLRSSSSKTITWTTPQDEPRWVRIEGDWATGSEYTAIESLPLGPVAIPTAGLLRHRVPDDVLLEMSSTDDHALFVDPEACTLVEYIGWSRLPGVLSGRKATVNDLASNERRLSVRPGWQYQPTNHPTHGSIDSPVVTSGVPLVDFDGALLHRPRTGTGASGGSAIPTAPGLVRLEEVFLTPLPGDTRVDPQARIDHAISAGLPVQHITAMPGSLRSDTPAPFVWPALTSDGCGGGTCADGSSGSDHHFPMGSRFRLGEQRCNQEWADPQAALIVEAMCTYGIVLTDSSHGFSISTERSPGPDGSKWTRTADAELSTLSLRDFELVDSSSIAAVDPDALWQEARAWAGAEYGFGSPLPGGWYSGRFWNRLLGCERGSGGTGCSDPRLDRVHRAVNGPDWFRARQP